MNEPQPNVGTQLQTYNSDYTENSEVSQFPQVPLNDMGLPTGFYRGDMISADYSENPEESENFDVDGCTLERQDALQHAFVPLDYGEGFPTLPSGTPYWNQLEHEPIEDYQLLDLYLQLPTLAEGARSLSFLPSLIEQHLQRDINLEKLQVLFSTYYWRYRAKSYDLFREAARRKQMELRALDVNNNHYLLAERLLKKLELYLDNEEDFWDLMTPKAAIDFLKALTSLQRVSVGMPSAGPPMVSTEGLGSPSFEVTLRTLAQESHESKSSETQNAEAVSAALADPKIAGLAQELIIKMGAK